MNVLRVFFILTLISFNSFSLELESGVISKGRDTVRNTEQRRVSPIIKSVIKEKASEGLKRSIGYTNMEEGNNWYRLNKDLIFEGVNVETKQYLGSWPLTPWKHTVNMIGEGPNWQARPLIANALGKKTQTISDPKLLIEDTRENYHLPDFKSFIGCLSNTPLRYGDIDQNGIPELVLILDEDFVIFSPSQSTTIFSTRFAHYDELAQHEVDAWFDGGLEDQINTQYVASSGVGNRLKGAFAATRTFAKIYFNDFNNDNKQDIIIWRKLYHSRLKSDPVKGFKLEGEILIHYQLENGQYTLQSQSPAKYGEYEWDQAQQDELRSWLNAKNQTWQSGFPSKSECAGQENQLIPDMHDPLLNDPDVLK